MWKLRRPHSPPAALDISADGLRLMQFSHDKNGLRIVAAARRVFDTPRQPTEPALADELRRALDQAPFTTSHVIASLPAEIAYVRTVRLPEASAGDLEARVRAETAGAFPFNLDDAVLRFMEAGAVRQGGQMRMEVIAIAARNDDVAAFLERVNAAGVSVESLSLAPIAVMRCARRFVASHAGDTHASLHAIVEVGSDSTTVIIGRGEQIKFLKPIAIGGRHMNNAVARKLDMAPDEVAQLRQRLAANSHMIPPSREGIDGAVFDAMRAVVEELARQVAICFRYHAVTFRGDAANAAALVGPEAADPHVRAALVAALGMELEVVDPLAGFDVTAMRCVDRERWAGEWTTCVGLALGVLPDIASQWHAPPECEVGAAPHFPEASETIVAHTTETGHAHA